MNGYSAVNLVESITILSIFKVLLTTLLVVYLIFAYLMMMQVRSMTRAVSLKDDFVMRVLSMGHFVFAALVLLTTIVVL